MKELKSFQVETKIGSGALEVFEKAGKYFAQYHGLSGLAHVKNYGQDSRLVDFGFDDTSYENIIEQCRIEIEKRDSPITRFVPISD